MKKKVFKHLIFIFKSIKVERAQVNLQLCVFNYTLVQLFSLLFKSKVNPQLYKRYLEWPSQMALC
jgi:hypothetical protein